VYWVCGSKVPTPLAELVSWLTAKKPWPLMARFSGWSDCATVPCTVLM
jgi:hypothetical protein